MAQVKDVLAYLEKIAPPEMKMDFDNVGLLAGWPEKEIKRAEVALDVSDDVILEAVENGTLSPVKQDLLEELEQRVADRILEPTNAPADFFAGKSRAGRRLYRFQDNKPHRERHIRYLYAHESGRC